LRGKVTGEADSCEACDRFESAGFGKEMGRARNDLETVLPAQLRLCGAVQVQDHSVEAADDEQRRPADPRQR